MPRLSLGMCCPLCLWCLLCGYTHMHFDINYVGSRCLGFDVGIHTTDGHTADGHTSDATQQMPGDSFES